MTCVISSCEGERLSAPFIFSHHSQTCLTRSSSSSWSCEVPHTANAHFDVWEPEKVPKDCCDPTTVISKPLFPPISAFNREEQRNDGVSSLLLCLDFADFPGIILLFLKTIQSVRFYRCWKWNAALEYSEMQISSTVTAAEMQTFTLVFETEFLTCKKWRILKLVIDLFQLILFVLSCLFFGSMYKTISKFSAVSS